MAVNEDRNWLNVGNWHWVSKDVTPWYHDKLRAGVQKIKEVAHTTNDDVCREYSITKVTKLDGSCTLNVRKGKLFPIYDIELSLQWKCVTAYGRKGADSSAAAATILDTSGELKVTDLTHDSAKANPSDELRIENELDPSCYERLAERTARKAVVAEANAVLLPELKKILTALDKDVVDVHGQSIYIENAKPSLELRRTDLTSTLVSSAEIFEKQEKAKSGTSVPIAIVSAKSGTVPKSSSILRSSDTSTASSEAKRFKRIVKVFKFAGPPSEVMDCFVDPDRLHAWSVGRPVLTGRVAGAEMLFMDGQLKGRVVSFDAGKRLAFSWGLQQWKGHESAAVIELDERKTTSSETYFNFTFENCPVAEAKTVEGLWETIYRSINLRIFGHMSGMP